MKSDTLPSFWEGYRNLDESMRRKTRKTYVIWLKNPFHPSLRFKCINHAEDMRIYGHSGLFVPIERWELWGLMSSHGFGLATMMNTSVILGNTNAQL